MRVFAALFALKNPGGFVLTVFALKNPGRGFCVERVRSQKPVVRVRVRSQKPLVGRVDRVRSQKPGSGVFVAVFALKNPGEG